MVDFKFFTAYLFLIFSFCFKANSQVSHIGYENIFESKDYIVILKLSSAYSLRKQKIENAIEAGKIETIKKSDIVEIENIIPKTMEKLNAIYSSVDKNEIRSQIYQIKFEIEQTSALLKEAKSKINRKEEFKKIIYKLEHYLYRIDVYLKGLSQNLSLL